MRVVEIVFLVFFQTSHGKRATSFGQMEKLLKIEDVLIEKLMVLTDEIAEHRKEISVLRDTIKLFQVRVPYFKYGI